jgi:hypothetical protein
MTAARLYSALLLALGTSLAHSPAQSSSRPIFRIETNEFWLSLHQFLYVLG